MDINKTPLDYARAACDTLMRKYSPEALPPKGHFHYHQGVFLSGMYHTYLLCADDKYFNYIQHWVDSIVDDCGDITCFNPGQLDDLQPGILLFPLYERTKDIRYKRALDTIAYYIETFPRNPIGGFWHKAWYHNQMWLDGLYMAGPFLAEYGKRFKKPAFCDLVVEQATIMRDHLRDPKTGLWYHAWDYDKEQPWANPVTGRSSEFWGRSIGWVPVALLDELEHMPDDHPRRDELTDMIRDLLLSLLPYQDEQTGLWYQVVDKGEHRMNWLETSCTCLYVAGIFKAVQKGVLEEDSLQAARLGYNGVIERLGKNSVGDVVIDNVCIGTCVGDYTFYCERPTSANDLHGVGAFLLMCANAQYSKK